MVGLAPLQLSAALEQVAEEQRAEEQRAEEQRAEEQRAEERFKRTTARTQMRARAVAKEQLKKEAGEEARRRLELKGVQREAEQRRVKEEGGADSAFLDRRALARKRRAS